MVYESENSKVITQIVGHIYSVEFTQPSPSQADNPYVTIAFQQGAVKEVGGRNGLQNEEVLAILIDRLKYLNAEFACRENSIVITKLEEALMWLEKRTANRKARNVEGLNKV